MLLTAGEAGSVFYHLNETHLDPERADVIPKDSYCGFKSFIH